MSHLRSTIQLMKQVQFWQWTLRDPSTGRVARTRWKMTAEEARALDALAQRVDGTMECRLVDTDDHGWPRASGVPASAPAGPAQGTAAGITA